VESGIQDQYGLCSVDQVTFRRTPSQVHSSWVILLGVTQLDLPMLFEGMIAMEGRVPPSIRVESTSMYEFNSIFADPTVIYRTHCPLPAEGISTNVIDNGGKLVAPGFDASPSMVGTVPSGSALNPLPLSKTDWPKRSGAERV
jgi:hypothetical protein